MDIKLLKKGIKFYSAYFQIEDFCILTQSELIDVMKT